MELILKLQDFNNLFYSIKLLNKLYHLDIHIMKVELDGLNIKIKLNK